MTHAMIVAGWYLFASIVAFVAYGIDKRAAVRSQWRIGEKQLHMWSLLGGAPGAWIGRRAFRHKCRRKAFSLIIWISAAGHALGWSIWLWRG